MGKTDKPLKILMILNRYLPVIGGAELQAHKLTQQLQTRGHNCTVITRHVMPELAPEETIDNVHIIRLRPSGLSHWANLLMLLRALFYLLWQSADVFHVHSIGPMGLATIIAGRLTRTPVILKIATRGDISRKVGEQLPLYTRLIRRFILPHWLWRAILQQASAIIVLTDELLQEAQANHLEAIAHRIGNGVDIDHFHPIQKQQKASKRQDLQLMTDKFYIFFSGRLVRRKRIDVVISACAAVIEQNPSVHLIIAGSGALQADSVEVELRQQVEQQGLQNHVTFLGNIDNVADYLRVVDCFAFPSEREGMPNVVLEAMASSLPIVASRIPSITELLDDTNAYLADVGDVDGFAQALRQIINKPDEAQHKGELVRQRAVEKYSLESIASQYEALYRDLLAR